MSAPPPILPRRCTNCETNKLRCVNEHADATRLVKWMMNPWRRHASADFTEGPERQVAQAFEHAISQERRFKS